MWFYGKCKDSPQEGAIHISQILNFDINLLKKKRFNVTWGENKVPVSTSIFLGPEGIFV